MAATEPGEQATDPAADTVSTSAAIAATAAIATSAVVTAARIAASRAANRYRYFLTYNARNAYGAGVRNLGANATRAADRFGFANPTANAVWNLASLGFAFPADSAARNLFRAGFAYPVAYGVANFFRARFAYPTSDAAVYGLRARLAYPAGTAARHGFANSLATVAGAANFAGFASRNPYAAANSPVRRLAAYALAISRAPGAASGARIARPRSTMTNNTGVRAARNHALAVFPVTTANRNGPGIVFGNANHPADRSVVRLGDRTTNIGGDFLLYVFRYATAYIVGDRFGFCFANRTSDGVVNRLVRYFANRAAHGVGVLPVTCFANQAGYLNFPLFINYRNLRAVSGNLLRLHNDPPACLHDGVASTAITVSICSGSVTNDRARCRTATVVCGAATTRLGPDSAR